MSPLDFWFLGFLGFWLSWPFQIAVDAVKSSQERTKSSQERLKTTPRGPKRDPRALKSDPRAPKSDSGEAKMSKIVVFPYVFQ